MLQSQKLRMKATAPETTATGTTMGAEEAASAVRPTAVAPTVTAPVVIPPSSTPEPAATAERPTLTLLVPVMVRESFSPDRPAVTA